MLLTTVVQAFYYWYASIKAKEILKEIGVIQFVFQKKIKTKPTFIIPLSYCESNYLKKEG